MHALHPHDGAVGECHPVIREHVGRSEEHTSELQSHSDLVCRLLLEKERKDISNPVTELSCKVSGKSRSSLIIGPAPTPECARAWHPLIRAVAACHCRLRGRSVAGR